MSLYWSMPIRKSDSKQYKLIYHSVRRVSTFTCELKRNEIIRDIFHNFLHKLCFGVETNSNGLLDIPCTWHWKPTPTFTFLGPFLFTMYTIHISSIITAFGLKHHLYGDDTQIYTSFVAKNIPQSLIFLKNCFVAIQAWLDQNMLKLNPSKTYFLIIGNWSQRKIVAHIFQVGLLLIQNVAEI